MANVYLFSTVIYCFVSDVLIGRQEEWSISMYECSRLTKDVNFDNTIVTGNEPYFVRSLVDCATVCTDTCIALSYSRDLKQCHVYMEHPDEEQLETKASMSLYLVEGVDSFISPTPVCPVLDQFLDVTLSPSQSFTIMITKHKQSQALAVLQCLFLGATLVRINTPEKQAFLNHALSTCPGLDWASYWIEGTNIQSLNRRDPDSWIFADLSKMPMGEPYWASEKPDNPVTSNCILMESYNKYTWNDFECYVENGYICEK